MAWEETDKALAEILRKLPQALTIGIFTTTAYFILKNLDFFQDKRITSNQPSKPTIPTTQPSSSNPTTKQENPHLPPIPPILTSSHHHHDKTHHLLLAATGSVATIKLPQIILSLSHHSNLSIRLILTKSSIEFLRGQASEQPTLAQISEFPNVEAIYVDEDEWRRPWTRGASILHIELRKWADLMVIAPLSANALAKVALGMSDNLVYSVVRAWDTTALVDEARPGVELPCFPVCSEGGGDADGEKVRKKGIIVAPAMNTAMWNHPVTKRHLDVLEGEWNVANGGWMEVLGPIDKGLACGDKGGGGMREWKEIVEVIENRMGLSGGHREVAT